MTASAEYEELRALIERNQAVVLEQLRDMSIRGERQDAQLLELTNGHKALWVAIGKLNRWTLIPDDYDPNRIPPGATKPLDIKVVVREANAEAIREFLSIGSLTKILGLLVLFQTVFDWLASRF